MAPQFIFIMKDLRKIVPPKREILKGIWLSFYPGAKIGALLTRFDEINARLGEPLDPDEMEKVLEEQSRVQDAIEAVGGWDLDRTVEIAMGALRCPPGEAEVATLSGGEVRRVALCRLLLSKPDMLLLDEPT